MIDVWVIKWNMIKEFESKKDSLVSFGTFWRSKYLSPTTSPTTVKAFNEEITQARTAHLDIKLKHVREMIMNQVIQVEHIRTTENIADLTKPLNGKKSNSSNNVSSYEG